MVNPTDKRPDVRALLVRLTPEMHRALKIAAAEDEVSVESIMRELIGQYLRERADERDLQAA